MATPAVNPGGGGAPSAAPDPQGGANPLQIIAGITRLAQLLAQTAPPCADEAQNTIQQMQMCAQKIMGAQAPQPAGPAPY